MECVPCGKKFTGQVCYEQHMKSEKHKRKAMSFLLLKSQTGTPPTLDDRNITTDIKQKIIQCDACDISFNSFESFQIHSFTREHAEKIILENQKGSLNFNIVSSSDSSINEKMNDIRDENKSVDKNDMILYESEENKKSQFLSFTTCDVCNKHFSGPEPYRQHLESGFHSKKAELQNSANKNTFSCEPCKKAFTGQIPYVQHMNSEVHKKKLQNLQFLEKHTSEVDSSSTVHDLKMEENNLKTDNSNTWFCNICNKQCSGYIPYQQHLVGTTHIKNNMKLQNIASSSVNSIQPAIHQCNNDEKNITWKTVNVPQIINRDNQLLNNQKMETDYILPEFVQNLKVMSTEELEESIKVFLPDENIDFDKTKNKICIDPANENVMCNISEVQVKEKQTDVKRSESVSEVYEVCNLCDVELLNRVEAANHYESFGHFNKRWRQN